MNEQAQMQHRHKVTIKSILFQSWKQQHIYLTTNLTLFHLQYVWFNNQPFSVKMAGYWLSYLDVLYEPRQSLAGP